MNGMGQTHPYSREQRETAIVYKGNAQWRQHHFTALSKLKQGNVSVKQLGTQQGLSKCWLRRKGPPTLTYSLSFKPSKIPLHLISGARASLFPHLKMLTLPWPHSLDFFFPLNEITVIQRWLAAPGPPVQPPAGKVGDVLWMRPEGSPLVIMLHLLHTHTQ